MRNLVEEIGDKIVREMTPEMSLAIAAGCELKHRYDSKKEKYTIETKNPCGITIDKKGLITVWEKVNGKKIKRAIAGADFFDSKEEDYYQSNVKERLKAVSDRCKRFGKQKQIIKQEIRKA